MLEQRCVRRRSSWPILEDAILPQPNDLFLAMKELAEY
jgi:hypothetical protein